ASKYSNSSNKGNNCSNDRSYHSTSQHNHLLGTQHARLSISMAFVALVVGSINVLEDATCCTIADCNDALVWNFKTSCSELSGTISLWKSTTFFSVLNLVANVVR